MIIKTRRIGESWLNILSIFLFVVVAVNGLDSTRKLDEATTPGSGEVKCGSCPVPPPPPVLCPPPPSPPPPVVKPPPSPKKPPSPYCPPPPSSYIYITGPPGDLYPIDESNRSQRTGSMGFFPALLGCALLGLFIAAY